MSNDDAQSQSQNQVKDQNNFATLVRFVTSLHLLRRLFPLILLLIVVASSTPQFYLWYVGEAVRCGDDRLSFWPQWDTINQCTVSIPYISSWFNWQMPLALVILLYIAFFGMVARILGWLSFELSGQWSTNRLHDTMIGALAHARTTYFDEQPSGHLINRILGDFGSLRMMGVIRVGDSINALVEVLSIAILVLLVSPWPALAMIPVTLIFLRIQLDLGPMLGHAEEISSAGRGEVLHRETDLIEGSRIFSLYNKQDSLLLRLHTAFASLANAKLLAARIHALARLWMRVIAAVYGFCVFMFLIVSIEKGQVSLTLAAVIVSAMFSLSGSFGWLSWCIAYLTETLGNARRVFEIIDLPDEVQDERAAGPMALTAVDDASLVLNGPVVFDRFVMSYRREAPIILKGLSMTIPAGKRTGIIGRTGAGKSSLIQALFRMVYVVDGDIRIGDQSIYGLNMDTLRRQFGVVPQNPYLFAGTLRDNLDRLNEVTDADLKAALQRCGITMPLTTLILEGGKNLSVGERQLICLARVLATHKNYILMDEPTSAVDTETDAKIQQILRTALAGRTLITIAHRLDTLRDYDHIIELGDGQLLRAGPPAVFWQR